MATPHTSGSFGDLLDPRFQKIFSEQYSQLPDMVPDLFTKAPDNGRDSMKWSGVGAYGDFSEFNGSVTYDSVAQGYDVTATHLQFVSGVQVDRELFDDDQYHIMDQKPRGLAEAAMRTRQKHAARLFNNAFSVDSYFYTNSENLSLCNDTHTSNHTGTSTATGFDNKSTSALTAVAVAAARIAMRGFRDDRANRISVMPNELWIPVDLFEEAYEIVASAGKVDTADNNANVHKGKYTVREWEYLTDADNWFMVDGTKRGQMVFWVDRVPLEFAFMEDFDTLVAKWRAYMRYSWAFVDWRWVYGHEVS